MTEWRTIPGFSRYQASSDGRIRSVGMARNHGLPFVRVACPNRDGYLRLKVCDDSGRYRTVPVHRLVAWAFIGVQPAGMQVNHKDGRKSSNAPSNLEYVTPTENKRHAFAIGLNKNLAGDKARNCRFLFAQLEEMRRLRGLGWKLIDIAKRFGTGKGYVCDVVRGKHRVAA